jgi:hypothetical protein
VSKKRKNNNPGQGHPNNPGPVANPPHDLVVRIPNSISVRLDPSADENKRHAEEKTDREAQLRAAQRLNTITKWGAGITFLTLLALYLSIYQGQKTFETGQRAWVLVDTLNISRDLSASSPTPVNFVVKNFGQSPALKFTSEGSMEFTGYACPYANKSIPYSSSSVLGPGQPATNPNVAVGVISQACLDALHSGMASFRIKCTLHYMDIFMKDHTTTVCVQYEGMASHQMTSCPEKYEIN